MLLKNLTTRPTPNSTKKNSLFVLFGVGRVVKSFSISYIELTLKLLLLFKN